MNALKFRIGTTHIFAFLVGLSVSLALTMCSDTGAEPDTLTLGDLETRVAALETALAAVQTGVVQVGTIVPFGATTPPTGFRLCDGSAVSRSQYADLFAAIGTAWGSGDGATTFNLPDLRGRFLRGVDNGAGRDPDSGSRTADAGGNTADLVGSVQGSDFETHSHDIYWVQATAPTGGPGFVNVVPSIQPTPYLTGSFGGSETRPVNAYVNYIIKI